jgi:hypothetical protein
MNSDAGDTTQLVPGYPIRTPWDHSLVDNSPRPIAASHVLHRLLMPRHPPSALDNLTTKILASTMHNSTNNQPAPQPAPHPTPHPQHRDRTRPRNPKGRAWHRNNNPSQPDPPATPTHGCSLRTQQDACTAAARPDRTTRSAPPRQRGWRYENRPAVAGRRLRQCLHPRAPPTRHPPDRGAPCHPPPGGGWCSLERR